MQGRNLRLCQDPLLAQKAFFVKELPYFIILYFHAVVALFSGLWSPPSPLRCPRPVGFSAWETLGIFFRWSCQELGDSHSSARPSRSSPIATMSRFLVRIKNRALSWPLTIFSSGDFLKKKVVCLVILSEPSFQVLILSPLQSTRLRILW